VHNFKDTKSEVEFQSHVQEYITGCYSCTLRTHSFGSVVAEIYQDQNAPIIHLCLAQEGSEASKHNKGSIKFLKEHIVRFREKKEPLIKRVIDTSLTILKNHITNISSLQLAVVGDKVKARDTDNILFPFLLKAVLSDDQQGKSDKGIKMAAMPSMSVSQGFQLSYFSSFQPKVDVFQIANDSGLHIIMDIPGLNNTCKFVDGSEKIEIIPEVTMQDELIIQGRRVLTYFEGGSKTQVIYQRENLVKQLLLEREVCESFTRKIKIPFDQLHLERRIDASKCEIRNGVVQLYIPRREVVDNSNPFAQKKSNEEKK